MSLHTGVIERWELLQAQDLSKEMRSKQNQQQWQQLNSDLSSVWTWLGETEEDLEQQRRLDLCTDIQTIQQRIKKLKVWTVSGARCKHFCGGDDNVAVLQELQKAYDKRKPIVLSVNLCSSEFVRTDTAESRQLQARLKDMNNHWDSLCSSLEEWRASLQEVLMQCQVGSCLEIKRGNFQRFVSQNNFFTMRKSHYQPNISPRLCSF